MTPISAICDSVIVVCPKCKTGQMIKEWGLKKCRFEGCGNEWEVPYDPELLVKEAVTLKKQIDRLVANRTYAKWKPPALQRLPTGGWVEIPQGYDYV